MWKRLAVFLKSTCSKSIPFQLSYLENPDNAMLNQHGDAKDSPHILQGEDFTEKYKNDKSDFVI